MWSLKFGRGPAIQRAIGAMVAGLFGILWTIAAVSLTANAPIPWGFRIAFPLFGVLFTFAAWGQAAWHFVNATSQQRFAEDDFDSSVASQPGRPFPITQDERNSPLAAMCARCRAPLQTTFHFCPFCGSKRV